MQSGAEAVAAVTTNNDDDGISMHESSAADSNAIRVADCVGVSSHTPRQQPAGDLDHHCQSGGDSLIYHDCDGHDDDDHDGVDGDDIIQRRDLTSNRCNSLSQSDEAQATERRGTVNNLVERVTGLERQLKHLVEPPRSRLAQANDRINNLEHLVSKMSSRLGRRIVHIDEVAGERETTSGLFRNVSELTLEVENVRAALAQERRDREQCTAYADKNRQTQWRPINSLRGQLDNIAHEVGGRTAGDDEAANALPLVHTALEQERADRAQGDADDDVRGALSAETRDRSHADDDLSEKLKALADVMALDLRSALEQEARVRMDEFAQSQAGLRRLQDQIEAETRDRNRSVDGFSEKLKALANDLAHEVGGRTAGDDETAKAFRLLQDALDQEASQRERDVGPLRASLTAQDSALRDALQTINTQLLTGLGIEAAERCAAGQQFETQVGDLRSALKAEAKQRGKLVNDTERCLRDLRNAFEQDVRIRADQARQNQAGLRQLQRQCEAEIHDRDQAVDGLREELKALTNALVHEVTDRRAGDGETVKTCQAELLALKQVLSKRITVDTEADVIALANDSYEELRGP